LSLDAKIRRFPNNTLKRTGVTLDCSLFYPSVAPFYQQSGVPFVRIDDIGDGFVTITDSSVFLPKPVLQQNPKTILRCSPGDIVIAKGGNTIAKVGILTNSFTEYSTCRDLIIIRTTQARINRFYLLAFLLSDIGQSLMIRTASQTGQPHLTIISIRELRVPIFSDRFQDSFEDILRRSEQRFQSAISNYAMAEQLLLSELGLQDWIPARALTFVRSYSQAAKAGRMDAEYFHPKYGELREHIRRYPNGFLRITDIAVNSDETVDPTAHPGDDYRYIELADINQVIGAIESANEIKGKDAPSRARMLLRAGDVVASTVEGSLDKVALVSEEYQGAIGSTGFFVLRPITVQSGYLLALVKSLIVREQMHCEASGTILAAVTAKSLQNIIVPNIPHEKQKEIAQLVEKSHAARREAKALLEKAKRAVEIAIEEGEDKAMEFLKSL
jgi:restriction endonuclease S subunit